MTELEELLLHSKPVKILVQLNNPSRDHYASQIAQDIDCTYSHAVRITQKLEAEGMIKTRKEGRKKMLELTSSGEEIARLLSELLHRFRQAN